MIQLVSKKGDSLDAVIVENAREGKKIRQRVICHIGVIHEDTAHELRDRVLFWKYTASPKLDRLSLDVTTRGKLEAEISAVIPKASKREIDQYTGAANKRLRELTEGIGRARRSA